MEKDFEHTRFPGKNNPCDNDNTESPKEHLKASEKNNTQSIEQAAREYAEGELLFHSKWPKSDQEIDEQMNIIVAAFLAGSNHSKGESAGVWVKASERFPSGIKDVFVRYLDTGKKAVKSGIGSGFKVMIDFEGYHYKKDQVEWFDESQSTTPSAGMKDHSVAFAEWLDKSYTRSFDGLGEPDGWYKKGSWSPKKSTSELYELWPERNQLQPDPKAVQQLLDKINSDK